MCPRHVADAVTVTKISQNFLSPDTNTASLCELPAPFLFIYFLVVAVVVLSEVTASVSENSFQGEFTHNIIYIINTNTANGIEYCQGQRSAGRPRG